MSKKLWFKARYFGWGWYPASWEGWLVTLIFIAALFLLGIRMEDIPEDPQAVTMQFILPLVGFIIVFFGIAFTKGEKPEWRWAGKPVGPDTARTLNVLTFVLIVVIIIGLAVALQPQ